MLKPEYSNHFNVAVRSAVHEVVINFFIGVTVAEEPPKTEQHVVSSIALTLENAVVLRDILTNAINDTSKTDEK
jgi:hypothetical protein